MVVVCNELSPHDVPGTGDLEYFYSCTDGHWWASMDIPRCFLLSVCLDAACSGSWMASSDEKTQVLAVRNKSERIWKESEQSLGGVCYGPVLADPGCTALSFALV